MKSQLVIRFLVFILVWGFLIYNLLPFGYFETYAVEERLAPRPYVERISYYFGVRIENPSEIIKVLEERKVNRVYGLVGNKYGNKIFPINTIPKCEFIILNDIPFSKKLFNFLFEFLPYKLLNGSNINYAYHLNPFPSSCKILFTYSLYEDLPRFFRDFLLNFSKNFVYKRIYGDTVLERNIVVNGKRGVDIYAYSTRSFYYPGESTIYPFKIFVNTNRNNTLILIFRNGKLFRVYDSDKAVMRIKQRGSYVVKIYKYRFKYMNFYFGLRFVAYSSPIRLTY